MPIPRRLVLVLGLALLAARPGLAQEAGGQTSFTISIVGLTAGRLALAADSSDTRYAVRARATSAGLAGLFSSFEVDQKVSGRVRAGRLQPEAYEARAKGARAGRGAEMRYTDGVPSLVTLSEEPRPGAPVIDPATMGGTVDPLTAMYAVLRTVPSAALCQLDLEIYDGHRHSRVTLRPLSDDPLGCQGNYRRINGYPPEDIAGRRDFPFVMRYASVPEGRFEVREVTLDSSYGKARVTRD